MVVQCVVWRLYNFGIGYSITYIDNLLPIPYAYDRAWQNGATDYSPSSLLYTTVYRLPYIHQPSHDKHIADSSVPRIAVSS